MVLFEYHQQMQSFVWLTGSVLFILSLKRGFISYQLRRLAWSLIVLIFIFVFSFVQIYNLFKGIYWIVFPLLCVPVNSALASLVGIPFGNTPLNKKNMPTKTLEGYIGGIILTGVWAYFVSGYLAKFQYLYCTQTSLCWGIFEGLTCELKHPFKPSMVHWTLFGLSFEFDHRSIQWHSVIISIFVSFVSPFGHFIINGFKKAFNIKVSQTRNADMVLLVGILRRSF
jgi:phosphatidate cytidylyltransferase